MEIVRTLDVEADSRNHYNCGILDADICTGLETDRDGFLDKAGER